MKNFAIILLIMTVFSCRKPDNFGFYQPITLSLKVPKGPPEYQAGWHAGCRTGLSQKSFSNSSVYLTKNHSANLGNGIYQHDQSFQTAWAQGWFSCVIHSSTFVDAPFRAMAFGPLE